MLGKVAADGSWTFVDQNGVEATIPSLPVTRMVMLQHHSLDMVCQLGAQDAVVGVEAKWQSDLGDYMTQVFPGIEDLTMGSGLSEWNVEEIAALRPDVVIAASQAPEDAADQLRAMGVPVVTVSLRAEGKQEVAQSPRLADADAAYTNGCEWAIKALGRLTGRDEQAAAIWDFVRQSRARVDEAVGDIRDDERVRAFVPMKDDKTYGNDKYVGCQLLRAGAVNVAATDIQGNGSYTVEQLAAWDPDVIIIQDRYMDLYEQFTTDDRYAALRAVKDGNVLLAPYWTKPWGNPDTDSMALGELWLAHEFYPDRVGADEVLARAKEFYRDFYGIEFTGSVDETA
ncbi:ABC transporter substrate-binding protein [bacterium]|nr:ABC transporter substrate-binding protein [bacterium]